MHTLQVELMITQEIMSEKGFFIDSAVREFHIEIGGLLICEQEFRRNLQCHVARPFYVQDITGISNTSNQ